MIPAVNTSSRIELNYALDLRDDNEWSASHPNLPQDRAATLGMEDRVGNQTEAQAATGAAAAERVSLDAPLLLSNPLFIWSAARSTNEKHDVSLLMNQFVLLQWINNRLSHSW